MGKSELASSGWEACNGANGVNESLIECHEAEGGRWLCRGPGGACRRWCTPHRVTPAAGVASCQQGSNEISRSEGYWKCRGKRKENTSG